MSLWTAQEAAAATGGKAKGDWAVDGVSIDTRTLQPGDLFVALTADRDGHDFVAQALAKGAGAALVSHVPDGVAEDASLLIVDNVLGALEALGQAARARTNAKVVGVTGSVGKTSTKEMLRLVLGGQGKTHVAEASYNNHWGVPLTLARMPVDTDYAVIEIGMNHPGEIAPLACMAQPDVAVITTVAAAHLEAFNSIEDIAREKAAIFDGLTDEGVALINADMGTAPLVAEIALNRGVEVLEFGQTSGATFEATKIALVDQTTIVHCTINGEQAIFKIGAPGKHFAMNALATIGVASHLGLDLAIALGDIGRWLPPQGRGTRERIVMDIVEDHMHFDLIDDAFNANPTSMMASLEVLSVAKTGENGRRVAVLGDMLELGAVELEMHRALAELPYVLQLDVIYCVGPRMKSLFDALPEILRGRWCEYAEELAQCAHALVHSGDVLLVKGSKGSKVSLVVDAVRKLGHSAPMSEQEGS